jgi:hypothetical protein
VETVVPAVKVGIASGPGVGAAVAVGGASDVEGAALTASDALGLADGETLAVPKRQPPNRNERSASAIGAGRRMRAA